MTCDKFFGHRLWAVDSAGLRFCHFPLTNPIAVNTRLTLPCRPWYNRREAHFMYVERWCNGYSVGLAISRSRVEILLGTTLRNLVTSKGRWCSAAGKVTAGLAESNGSLPPGGWLTPRLHDTTCCQTGCQTGLTTGCIVYTAGCQPGCTTRFDNRLNEQRLFVQNGCQTGCQFVYTGVLRSPAGWLPVHRDQLLYLKPLPFTFFTFYVLEQKCSHLQLSSISSVLDSFGLSRSRQFTYTTMNSY